MIARRKPNDDFTFRTIDEVADWLDVPKRTIERWPQRHTQFHLGKQGAWSAKAFARCAVSLAKNPHAFADEEGGTVRDRLAVKELELKTELVSEKRRENEVAESKLVPREEVEQWAAGVFCIFREAKIAIPDAIAGSIEPERREWIREELDRREREALRQARIKIDELANVDPPSDEAA